MLFRRSKPVPRSQELIFLDADDDLGTIRSKLEASTTEEVFLVIPRRSAVLRTPLEFRILARIANEQSAETILVTDDGNRRRLAHQEGFRTRRSLRTLKHLMLAPGQRRPWLVVPDFLPIPSLWTAFVYLVGLAIIAGIALVAVPQMTVTLVPQTTQVTRTVQIIADPAAKTADPSTGALPSETLTQRTDVSASLAIPADRTVGDQPAKGTVQVTSTRDASFTLPAGTKVQVPGGPTYTTDQPVNLNKGVPARVAVTATDPGTGGNQAPNTITAFVGPGFDGLQVTNLTATSGGTDKQGRVVTADDQQNLHQQMLDKAKSQLLTQIRTAAGASKTVPDVGLSMQVVDETYDHQPGDQVDSLNGKMTVSGTATGFDNLAFNNLAGQILASSAGSDEKLSGDPKLSVPQTLKADGQKVYLQVQASGVLQRAFDLQAINRALVGKTPKEAEQYLAQLSGQAQPPQVSVSPSWAPRAFRIQVTEQGPK